MDQGASAVLKHACPLVHPADFSVRVRGSVRPLYRRGFLEIEGREFMVHHDPDRNRKARIALLERLEDDPELREQWVWAVSRPCVQSFILWLNWFGFTYAQKEAGADGREVILKGRATNKLFITYPCQDRASAELFDAIWTGFDVTVDKSRQMGATWLIAAMITWFVLFHSNMNFAVLSRVEELVDNPGDPQSVFFKIDYLIKRLPAWMKGTLARHKLKLVNLSLNSTIMGRSTTGTQGRGGAVNAAFIDEASQIDELESIWTSFAQSTACRIANSTPYGAGYFSTLVRNPSIHKIVLPWWEHPLKGRGRFIETDPGTDEQFVCSPYYVTQCLRATPDPGNWMLGRRTREIAQELDMDHSGSGRLVFDYHIITRQLSLCPPHPLYRGDIVHDGERLRKIGDIKAGDVSTFGFEESDRGRWELWTELVADQDGMLRPPQDRTYCMGIDVAQGVGASESVISVYCVDEKRKVAQFCSSNVSPVALAIIACMAGWWFGGEKGMAFIAWESNGYGQSFGKALLKLRYPWFYRDTDEGQVTPKKSRKYGWHSNRAKKLLVFDSLRAAMAKGEFSNPSRKALDQAAQMVHYEGGGIGPAVLEVETEEARSLHGDCVTADALAWYGSTRMGVSRIPDSPPPRGSAAWRREHPDSIVKSRGDRHARRRKEPARPARNPFRNARA